MHTWVVKIHDDKKKNVKLLCYVPSINCIFIRFLQRIWHTSGPNDNEININIKQNGVKWLKKKIPTITQLHRNARNQPIEPSRLQTIFNDVDL